MSRTKNPMKIALTPRAFYAKKSGQPLDKVADDELRNLLFRCDLDFVDDE
jgi:hypothetical protein